ncbi:MAG: hypothetical protein R3B82_03905 [Sandaracinaceae bacterium]
MKVLERSPSTGVERSTSSRSAVLLLGAGEGASPALLAELDPDDLPAVPEPKSFGDLVAKRTKREEP